MFTGAKSVCGTVVFMFCPLDTQNTLLHFPLSLFLPKFVQVLPASFSASVLVGNVSKKISLSSSVSHNFQFISSFPVFPNLSPVSESSGPFISLGLYHVISSATVMFSSFSLTQSPAHSSKSRSNVSFFKELM